jgi:hypothetical protein
MTVRRLNLLIAIASTGLVFGLVSVVLTANANLWPVFLLDLVCVPVNIWLLASWCLKRRALLTPVPPTNVRLIIDGELVPVSCRYEGFDGVRHQWAVITTGLGDIGWSSVNGIDADEMPANAAISFEVKNR